MAPLKVAVLGAGPSGLFFCHNIEKWRQQWVKEGTDLCDFPEVTVFEKTDVPGGVWREKTNENSTPGMYENLWTNGPCHLIEMYDHTFDDHFGRPVTVYLKRDEVLDYVIGRVTKNCPNFMEKYIQFHKEVMHVDYVEAAEKFCVTIKDTKTGKAESQTFDKCVWACGDNGIKFIPQGLKEKFKAFKGRVIHSAETENLEKDVKGKKVLMIGGSYSAEDLALQAIKLGAEKIYITSRTDGDAVVSWTGNWPGRKVTVLSKAEVSEVSDYDVKFTETEWEWPHKYTAKSGKTSFEIRDIDTVIFCTGFETNMRMLSNDLKTSLSSQADYGEVELHVPPEWEMSNPDVTEMVGEVSPGKTYHYPSYSWHETYRGVLIKNPNMMFVDIYGTEFPLVGIDVYSRLLSGFITGDISLPSQEEMRQRVYQQALCELQIPGMRFKMDSNFSAEVDEEAEDGFWERDESYDGPTWADWEKEVTEYGYRVLARAMREARYPFDMGTYEALNDTGKTIVAIDDLSYYHRANVACDKENGPSKTFRDYEDGEKFYSFFTGTRAVNLEKPWLEM